MKKCALLLCLCALLGNLLPWTAQAAGLDLSRSGSLMLQLSDSQGNAASGGEYLLYRVGEPVIRESGLRFELAPDFQGSGVSLDDPGANRLAESLAVYAGAHPALPCRTQTADEEGCVRFEAVESGLYLVVQSAPDAAYPYERMTPFVVSVPMGSESGDGWVWDVIARPKVEPTPAPSTSPRPTNPPEDSRLPQTGQLKWPVPVLAVAGLALFAAGWVLCFAGKRHE